MDPISDRKKMILSGTYASRQLLSMLEGIIELKVQMKCFFPNLKEQQKSGR